MSPALNLREEFGPRPVVVKAWAPWCGSCRALAPQVENAAVASGVPVADLRVDDDPDNLVDVLGVRSVPTLVGLRGGTEVARLTGLQDRVAIEALFASTQTGIGTVKNQPAAPLVVMRAVAGVTLMIAGAALNTVVPAATGVVLIAWALAGFVMRPD